MAQGSSYLKKLDLKKEMKLLNIKEFQAKANYLRC